MDKKVDILEAEGELNREIITALNNFRTKVIENSAKQEDSGQG